MIKCDNRTGEVEMEGYRDDIFDEMVKILAKFLGIYGPVVCERTVSLGKFMHAISYGSLNTILNALKEKEKIEQDRYEEISKELDKISREITKEIWT